VYGLGADADSPQAVRAIFSAKGRPADHPVIVHVAGKEALAAWADVPPAALLLAEAFWPGPLTLVLPRRARAHDLITGGQSTVGLRCPAHPWARALLAGFCAQDPTAGVAAPSANSFGRISPTTAAHVQADLDGRVDLVLDGGACPVGIESAIVDVSAARPRLLRPGAITRGQIEAVLGEPLPDAGADAPRASGRLASHYAPRCPLELVDESSWPARLKALQGRRLALLAPARWLPPAAPELLRMQAACEHVAEYERQLYRWLHDLDAAGAERILVMRPPAGPAWEAVHDRLGRAATPPDGFGLLA
jgi:L-threonylcarbamoyladenylate synthase